MSNCLTPVFEWAGRATPRGTKSHPHATRANAPNRQNRDQYAEYMPWNEPRGDWFQTLEQPQPATAALAAAGVNGLWLVAHFSIPGLTTPTIAIQAGLTLGAAAFGWSVVDHPKAALGAVSGAMCGAGLATLAGLGVMSLAAVMVLMAGLGSYAGHHAFCAERASSSGAATPRPAEIHHRQAEVEVSNPHRVRLRRTAASASSMGGATPDVEWGPASPEWRQQLRRDLEHLQGPYAAVYRAKGLHQLTVCEGEQTAEDRRGTCAWLHRFERLVQTLQPVLPVSAEQSAQFDAELERRLSEVWGNEEVKTEIWQCVAMQQEALSALNVVCVAGGAKIARNRISNVVKGVYEISREIQLPQASLQSLTGVCRTYVDAQPSLVAQLLIESPESLCVLHIDEIDEASLQQQRALLSLLEPEHRFVDRYFELPLNRARLLVLCTMKADAKGLANLDPGLLDRLKQHLAYASRVTA